MLDNLVFLSTDDEIIVYWDKPEEATPETEYTVKLSNGKTVITKMTDAAFKGLESDKEYAVDITSTDNRFQASIAGRTKAKKNIVYVTDFGAVADGKTVCTKEIQAAIDACGKNDILCFCEGTFLSGALRLHSNMEIYLAKDSVLQGTEEPSDYLPKIHSRFEGIEQECYQSLINIGELDYQSGPNCENIIIRGEGAIYGGGKNLAKAEAKAEAEILKDYIASLGDRIKEYEKPETIASRVRGRLINMSNCKNVWIHGLKLGQAPSWNVHFIYSDGILTDACEFYSQGIWNGDGWDPDSSENCTIFNCKFYTEDDSVAIKAGKNPQGLIINRPTKNIRVFDCVTHFGHGICMGSEMSGGIDGVKIWDCEVGPTWSGIEIKATKKRGGYVRNIEVTDVTASHIQMHSVGYNDDGEGSPVPPILENCKYKRMHLLGRFLDNNAGKDEWHDCPAIDLQGFDVEGYDIKNISFTDIEFENTDNPMLGSIHMKYCKDISFANLSTASERKVY